MMLTDTVCEVVTVVDDKKVLDAAASDACGTLDAADVTAARMVVNLCSVGVAADETEEWSCSWPGSSVSLALGKGDGFRASADPVSALAYAPLFEGCDHHCTECSRGDVFCTDAVID